MDYLAEVFERERPKLFSLAYRMLGERAAAEDVVQDAWLRWSATDRTKVDNPGGWLRRTTTNLAIDTLRSARARREVYVGPWLPEALLSDTAPDPGEGVELAEKCELALLWAMERLTPEERAAFILRSVFDADYSELAATMGKSEAACRQLVSRARKRVDQQAPKFTVSREEQAGMLTKFVQACAVGDHASVLSLLAPDVVAVSDGGGKVRAALRPLHGPAEVAQVALAVAEKAQGKAEAMRMVFANGNPALTVLDGGEADMVFTISVNADGLIDWVYVLRNPEKLP